VASITSLAENLGILTVAEGIETQDIVGALQSINCTWGQGYHFAKPMTAADAEAYILSENKGKRSA
jgi:EAL domain-containing protein (putative c-di-GMP-specific phosphodiesterase class I)